MAKRKRSMNTNTATTASVALAASVSSSNLIPPAPLRPDVSSIPRTFGPPSDTNAASPRKQAPRSSRRRGLNSAQIDSVPQPSPLNGAPARRTSPEGDEGLGGIDSGMKPGAVSLSSDGEIHAAPGAAAGAKRSKLSASAEVALPGAVHGRTRTTADNAIVKGPSRGPPTSTLDPLDTDGSGDRETLNSSTKHVKVNGALSNDNRVVKVSARPNKAVEQTVGVTVDPEAEGPAAEDEDEEEVKEALSRPPPVNSAYLPLPWKGRLGYACLNTYLRNATPPVFSSRTCRIASIIEHRHPPADPSQPGHPTKNRPDKGKPADIRLGQKYVEELGLANARDIMKMLRWNDKYGIRFMRLSSEMFPFASHAEYGYKLAPFAGKTLREVGKVVAELGHRVTTHPGQFTQLGSPRKEVIDASIRDLEYHDEMLSLMGLPPQQDRDAVMILHLGGVFGDKEATLDRFRKNYQRLSNSVRKRLVLENDDVSWSVHDLLPLCQELNIPMVLDFHHHNILFDADKLREGTKDIMELFPAILETWKRKNITPKMHYSEPCPDAITARSRRKHAPRVSVLPPCPDTMDLMIEAKDKEQAVFELMRTYKLPGFDLFNDVIPHVRQDENRPVKAKPKKAARKGKKEKLDDLDEEEETGPILVPDEEVGMGGPERRVYWPPGMEDWLRPPKRAVKKKEEGLSTVTAAKMKKTKATDDEGMDLNNKKPGRKAAPKKIATTKKRSRKQPPTPPTDDDDSSAISDLIDDEEDNATKEQVAIANARPTRRRSGRTLQKVSYKEEDADVTP